MNLSDIANDARAAAIDLCDLARLSENQIVVVGCSTSEIAGHKVGSHSSPEIGKAVFDAMRGVFAKRGIFLAAQCCEHLNRCLVVESQCPHGGAPVSVIPVPNAGGSFAAAAYAGFANPVVVESIRANAGIDIGGTLIGMHLLHVAVPVRLGVRKIGDANLVAARTRAKLIGGSRAVYDEKLI